MGSLETQDLVEKVEQEEINDPQKSDSKPTSSPLLAIILEPFQWLQMLSKELNPSFVVGVVLVYGLSQGFAGSFFRVATDYYWKDVQRVQPSYVQLFIGLYYIPWILKPVWGLLTDVFPVNGYHRRPYFVLAGVLGTVVALVISIHGKLPVIFALFCLIGMTAGVAIADVTIDACIAKNSIDKPLMAPDMQSLCGFCSAIGALLGYSTSGLFLHQLGPQGALGLLSVPPALLVVLGFLIYEKKTTSSGSEKKAILKVGGALSVMYRTIKCPQVWKPSLYMYLSLALSISTHEGQFYWYTDPNVGPAFSQEFLGIIYAIGAMASLVGVLIYHKILKNYPFRSLLFYAQLLYGLSGMLELIFVLRWNIKFGIPDSVFVIMEECTSHIITKIRWMPMIVLSTKLCPSGIEGTFFALLMCIDSLGSLSSKSGGGVLLHMLNITRSNFENLWLVIFIRNLLRIATLGLIFLVPRADQSDVLLPSDLSTGTAGDIKEESLQLVSRNEKVEV